MGVRGRAKHQTRLQAWGYHLVCPLIKCVSAPETLPPEAMSLPRRNDLAKCWPPENKTWNAHQWGLRSSAGGSTIIGAGRNGKKVSSCRVGSPVTGLAEPRASANAKTAIVQQARLGVYQIIGAPGTRSCYGTGCGSDSRRLWLPIPAPYPKRNRASHHKQLKALPGPHLE